MTKRKIIFIIIDILIISITFLFLVWIKPASKAVYLPKYFSPFTFLLSFWIALSILINKYNIEISKGLFTVFKNITVSGVLILTIAMTGIYVFQLDLNSRSIVIGTIIISYILELAVGFYLYDYSKDARISLDKLSANNPAIVTDIELQDLRQRSVYKLIDAKKSAYAVLLNKYLKDNLQLFHFIKRNIDLISLSATETMVVSTRTKYNIQNFDNCSQVLFINLQRINDIRRINQFFYQINYNLKYNGYFVGCVETKNLRKKRILKKYPVFFNTGYYIIDFIFKRIFPKLPITKQIYFTLTGGRNRVISKTETLGRLYSCGFKIVAEENIQGHLYFICKKEDKPQYPKNASYGALIRLKRYGKDGKPFNVYKFRTMHPYAEFIQDYIYEKNSIQNGGKFSNDFRVTTLGRFMRKFWIDELPMFINYFKGEMKIVGVRPLSKQYLSLYRKEVAEKRLKYKPGLIPPFYADLPETLDEIQESEMQYLKKYDKNPIITDISYFFKAWKNILFNGARSR